MLGHCIWYSCHNDSNGSISLNSYTNRASSRQPQQSDHANSIACPAIDAWTMQFHSQHWSQRRGILFSTWYACQRSPPDTNVSWVPLNRSVVIAVNPQPHSFGADTAMSLIYFTKCSAVNSVADTPHTSSTFLWTLEIYNYARWRVTFLTHFEYVCASAVINFTCGLNPFQHMNQ